MVFKSDFEWLTSNTRVAYPFTEKISPLNVGESDFSDLTVDAYVLTTISTQQNIKLSYLEDPTAVSPKVTIKFADDTIAFDSDTAGGSTVNFKTSIFGEWTVLEWTNTAYGVARLLLKTDAISDYAWPVAPVNAFLVAFTTQPASSKVKTVSKGTFVFDGDIELVSGFNVDLVETDNPEFVDSTPQRGRKFVRIDTSEGLGLGNYLDCDPADPPVVTINGIGPDSNGNLALNGDDCYRLEIPIDEAAQGALPGPPWHLEDNTLKIYNNCAPCCDCEDYIHVYDDLERTVYARAKAVSDKIYSTRDSFRELVEKVNQEKACREVPTLQVRLVSRPGWTATVQAIIRNNQACQVDYIYLDFAFGGVTRPLYVPSSGYFNSKTTKQERFDPETTDPCSDASLETMWSSSSLTSGRIWRWPYQHDTCVVFPHYYVTYTDPLLGTDMLTVTFQVYYASYGTRKGNRSLSMDVTGFVGPESVSASAHTVMESAYNKG